MKEYDIEDLVSQLDFHKNSFQNINGMMLTNYEIEILEQYKIPYQNYHDLKELLFSIEDVISDMEIVPEELDLISSSISERDYYENTNK